MDISVEVAFNILLTSSIRFIHTLSSESRLLFNASLIAFAILSVTGLLIARNCKSLFMARYPVRPPRTILELILLSLFILSLLFLSDANNL